MKGKLYICSSYLCILLNFMMMMITIIKTRDTNFFLSNFILIVLNIKMSEVGWGNMVVPCNKAFSMICKILLFYCCRAFLNQEVIYQCKSWNMIIVELLKNYHHFPFLFWISHYNWVGPKENFHSTTWCLHSIVC